MADAEQLAGRYVRALAAIVATLGPEDVCGCDLPPECGLRDEAAEALRIAKGALAGADVE